MRALRLVLALILVAPLVPITAEAATYTVRGYNTYWSPSSLTIVQGDSVRFENGAGGHNVVWTSYPSGANPGNCGLPCMKTFNTVGTYGYRCGVHPSMTGSIAVNPAVPPPSVSISSPTGGSTVSGTITVSGSASHATHAITKVEVKVDSGTYQLATLSGSGTSVTWSMSLNTDAFADGSRKIWAKASTSASSGETSVTVTFANGPTTTISAPAAGDSLFGTVAVSGTATAPTSAVTKVEVRVGSGPYALATLSGADWTYALDTTAHADGARSIYAKATTASGKTHETSVGVTFANAPTVAFTSHVAGDDVDGTPTFEGTATSPASPIAKVEWRLGSGPYALAAVAGSGTSVTWSFPLDTTGLANGPYTLFVKATTDGGHASETSLLFDVANPPTTDLRVTGVSGTTGTTFSRITVGLANDGNTGSGTVHLRIEYEYKGTWRLVAEPTVSVPAFGTSSVVVQWGNAIWMYGKFPIRATVDSRDVVAETDEANNVGNGTAAFMTPFVNGVDLRNP